LTEVIKNNFAFVCFILLDDPFFTCIDENHLDRELSQSYRELYRMMENSHRKVFAHSSFLDLICIDGFQTGVKHGYPFKQMTGAQDVD
jgi:hypothetical protein